MNMSQQPDHPAGGGGQEPPREPAMESLQFDPVGARVPEHVAAGTFSSGVIILDGWDEFVLDFVQGVSRPPRVAARVILNPRVMGQFIEALRANLQRYQQQFGTPPEMPKPPTPEPRPSIKDIYDGLKLPDEQLSGAYANAVRIAHSPSEFCLDFITRFFPTAAVSSRVYMAAPQIPRLLESLVNSHQHFVKKRQQAQPPPPPPGSPPGPPPPPQDPGQT